MAIPDDLTLQSEILEFLASRNSLFASVDEVFEEIAKLHPELTYEETSVRYNRSRSKFANRVQFARLHLVQSGHIYKSNSGKIRCHGIWELTAEGKQAVKP